MTTASANGAPGVRCPSCGALVGADVEWCPQCFTSLHPSQVPPVPSGATAAAPDAGSSAASSAVSAPVHEPGPPAPPPGALAERPDAQPGPPPVGVAGSDELGPPRTPTWACPVCETENPLEADACTVCGTPFAQLLRQDPARKSVDPSAAMRRSLLFPGLGHAMVGESIDGFVWGFLFVFVLAMAVLLVLARLGQSLAPILPIVGALVAVAVWIWIFTATEAARLARGLPPLLARNRLPWVAAGVVAIVMVLSLFIVMTASRGR